MRTQVVDLDGPVHYADFGGEGEPLVLVHGLGGSHVNWQAVAPRLARHRRVLAPDLAGFGRTAPAGRRTTIEANRALLDRFIAEVAGGRAALAGNSMGGLISLMEAATQPERVSALVLVDAALPRPWSALPDPWVTLVFLLYSIPGLGSGFVRRRAERLGPEGLVRETLRLCCVDPDRIDRDVYAAHEDLARERAPMEWASDAFLQAARSIVRALTRPRHVAAMIDRITAPTLVLQGTHDRLVPVAAARSAVRRRPEWELRLLPGTGHVPMLEAPERFVELVEDFLDRHAPAAATALRQPA